VGVAAALFQEMPNGEGKRYILFAAKALNTSQQRYPATKKELLAILFALREFHQWIAFRTFRLFTDHRALTYIHTQAKLPTVLQYWHDVLQAYDFQVFHRPGIINILPDRLSRLFPKTLRRNELEGSKEVVTLGSILAQRELVKFVRERLDKETPEDEQQRSEIVREAHEKLGHRGANALFAQIFDAGYYWPSMRAECRRISAECEACLRESVRREGFHPLEQTVRTHPWTLVAIDLFGPLATSTEGHNYCLVVVDIASRFTVTKPLDSKSAASTAVRLLEVFHEHGFPEQVRSDRGTEFNNALMKQLRDTTGVEWQLTPPYSPQSNGAAEAHVKLLRETLKRMMSGDDPATWDRWLPAATWAVNNRPANRLSGATPFALYFGRTARIPLASAATGDEVTVGRRSDMSPPVATEEELLERAQELHSIVWPASRENTEGNLVGEKKRADNRRHLVSFEPGDIVMLRAPPRAPKSEPRYTGPFKILERDTTVKSAYRVLDEDGKLHPKPLAVQRLKLISHGADEPEWEVESIVDERTVSGRPTEYRVRWVGFGPDSDTWEPRSSFESNGAVTVQLSEWLERKNQ
jgi:transposase InsO family protein